MDLGECTKIHDLALRADYEIASKERDLFFELDVSDVFNYNKKKKFFGKLHCRSAVLYIFCIADNIFISKYTGTNCHS